MNKFLIGLVVSVIGVSKCAAQIPALKDFKLSQKIYQYSDSMKVEAYVSDGKVKTGNRKLQYFYYKTGKIHSAEGYRSGKVLDGPYTKFHVSGQVIQKGFFKEGLRDGKWMLWSDSGRLLLSENYRNGRLSGWQEVFSARGGRLRQTHFFRGKKDGYETHYDSVGSALDTLYYVNGRIVQRKRIPSVLPAIKRLLPHKRDSVPALAKDTVTLKKLAARK